MGNSKRAQLNGLIVSAVLATAGVQAHAGTPSDWTGVAVVARNSVDRGAAYITARTPTTYVHYPRLYPGGAHDYVKCVTTPSTRVARTVVVERITPRIVRAVRAAPPFCSHCRHYHMSRPCVNVRKGHVWTTRHLDMRVGCNKRRSEFGISLGIGSVREHRHRPRSRFAGFSLTLAR